MLVRNYCILVLYLRVLVAVYYVEARLPTID